MGMMGLKCDKGKNGDYYYVFVSLSTELQSFQNYLPLPGLNLCPISDQTLV